MKLLNQLLTILIPLSLAACGSGSSSGDSSTETEKSKTAVEEKADPLKNLGVGVIKSLTLGDIDPVMVEEGKVIYEAKCTACHKPTEKYIGPSPAGIMKRRSPEWIMNMILNPELMIKEDPIAIDLFKEYLAPMANQNLTEDEARKILEYFRTL